MLKNLFLFCKRLITEFLGEGCPLQAAGLSYVSLLSLVPLMTVSLSILAAFPVFHGIGTEVQQFILNNFIASSAQAVQHQLQVFMDQTTRLSVAGTAFLFVTAVMMVFSLEQAFNHIWKVKNRRNFVQAFLMYWAVLTLTPVLIGLGFVISSYVMTISFIHKAALFFGAKKIFFWIAPSIFTFLAFTLLYIAVPNCKVKLSHAAIGAIFSTIFFEIVKHVFSLYILHFPTYRLIYGALAAIPIFLLWLYLSWLVILFGALISYELGHKPKA